MPPAAFSVMRRSVIVIACGAQLALVVAGSGAAWLGNGVASAAQVEARRIKRYELMG